MDQITPGLQSDAPISRRTPHGSSLPWISAIPGIPYFRDDDGRPWHPIGQNDAISWSELNPLFLRRNVAAVRSYLRMLAAHGVTCMRLMLEYAQVRHRYFERAVGEWSPNMVRYWDDLFSLCEEHGIRVLLTPFDTFWMWLHFRHHPYSVARGGMLKHPSQALLSKETRRAIKDRLGFAAQRWGGSGALFAWDLWNEIHPAQAEMSAEPFVEFIEDLSAHVRSVETRAHGRAHLQTVSLFGPELRWRPEMRMEEAVFRHPSLDFATVHIYEEGTIDDPQNTVDAAIGMGRIVRESLAEIRDHRPFLDTEHGPIHRFKDHHVTLPEAFDDEYFRHMQWAHLASGGAGGGMRWPNRTPHSLTTGMRVAQRGLADFLPLIDWPRFRRSDLTEKIRLCDASGNVLPPDKVARFAVGTEDQAMVYLLRRDTLSQAGQLDPSSNPLDISLDALGLSPGTYSVTAWNTVEGVPVAATAQQVDEHSVIRLPPLVGDMAVAVRR